ncbi:hypothetical protein [Halocatena halophila]|uniref:hypothetical protein n=1 Tax=Halocatena halophila TaxID=2814576 RepID=UPI002ED5E689
MSRKNSDQESRIEAQVAEPKVSGVDPALAEKDPEEVTAGDLAGLDEDARDQILNLLSADNEEIDTEKPVTEPQPDNESGDSEPEEPATLDETGLLDDDGNFPWEGESLGTTTVGESGVIERFEYKGVLFEIHEPEDRAKFERNFDQLAGAREQDDRAKKRSIADRYSRKLADQCLTVDGHELEHVYRVTHNETHHVVPDVDGSKGLASHSSATLLWDSMTWFDRFKLGMKLGEDVLGESQFRPRVS